MTTCTTRCPMWGMPIGSPRTCPLCGQVFKDTKWDAVEDHYRSQHKDSAIPHEEWWDSVCNEHRN
ncbi:MAG: hypothetical protein WD208_11055 [Dehalococcoidia bacterium]